jgi:general secretion pathway protein F
MPTTHPILSYRIRAELFTQLAQMEIAGLPTENAFAILKVQRVAEPRLVTMRQLLKRSEPATAGERSGLFTKLEARLVRASLLAGSPARIYQRLGETYTQRAMQLATIKSRMALPVSMFIAALMIAPIVGLVIGSYGLPTYLWMVAKPILMIGAVILAARWLITLPTITPSLLTLPIVGPIIVRRNVRDFFESLALMLEAGVSMFDALPLALDAIESPPIKTDFARIAPRVTAGAPLSDAIKDLHYLGDDSSRERAISFIHTGEASGTLPEMLLRHVNFETDALNHQTDMLATWLPRIFYGFVVVWMAMGILGGPGEVSRMPEGL